MDAAHFLPDAVACNIDRIPDRQPEKLNLLLTVQRLASLESD